MTQIQIVNGIYVDTHADYRTSYPVNLVPVPKAQGISGGYLRPGDGLLEQGEGPGRARGGINWNGTCYRVMGTKLVKIAVDGTLTELGDVGGTGPVSFDFSFDVLSIASDKKLWYYNEAEGLTVVTDHDIGDVIDQIWVDGYFMTTDGRSLIVTDLNDRYSVNLLRYGSSEVDPDPIVAVLKLRNEPHAINSSTIEVFENIGGTGFPFQRNEGAQIQKGAVGTHACCVFDVYIALLGNGKENEAYQIYLAANASTETISTREIDQLLKTYSVAQLSRVVLEQRIDKAHKHLYVHLPDRTIVYDQQASLIMKEPIWFQLTSTLIGFSRYRGRYFVQCYNEWLVGDPTSSKYGKTTTKVGEHFGERVRWEFGTCIIYNKSKGVIVNSMELVALTGSVAPGVSPTIATSWSEDGINWSQNQYIPAGKIGDRLTRLIWLQQGQFRNWRVQRFQGDSQAHISFTRLEAEMEGLNA